MTGAFDRTGDCRSEAGGTATAMLRRSSYRLRVPFWEARACRTLSASQKLVDELRMATSQACFR